MTIKVRTIFLSTKVVVTKTIHCSRREIQMLGSTGKISMYNITNLHVWNQRPAKAFAPIQQTYAVLQRLYLRSCLAVLHRWELSLVSAPMAAAVLLTATLARHLYQPLYTGVETAVLVAVQRWAVIAAES